MHLCDDVTLFPSVERDSPHPAALESCSLRGWLVLCVWLSDGDRAGNKLTCPFVAADTALWICSRTREAVLRRRVEVMERRGLAAASLPGGRLSLGGRMGRAVCLPSCS